MFLFQKVIFFLKKLRTQKFYKREEMIGFVLLSNLNFALGINIIYVVYYKKYQKMKNVKIIKN